MSDTDVKRSLSDPTDVNARFTKVPLKALSKQV